MSENDDNFKEIVRNLQENLCRDKEEVERAVKNFMQLHKNVSYWNNKECASNSSDSKEVKAVKSGDLDRRVASAPPRTSSRSEFCSSQQVKRSDTTMAINGRRNYRTPVYSNALVMPAPKYGLPGLGEYEEKRKKYQQEWKQEYNKYLSELAERPKRKQRNADDLGILDYEEMLTRKREEERQYRHHNGELAYPNVGGIRPARSEGHLDRNGQTSYNGHENGSRLQHHETRDIGGVRYNDHVHTHEEDYNHYDHNYSYETTGAYRRPHSYPTDTNGFVTSDELQRNAHSREEDESFSPRDYHRHNVDEQRIERRRRESLGREVENYYRDNSNANNGGHRYSDAVHDVHSHRPLVDDRNHMISNPGNDYHAELSRQVADVKLRKRREKEEQIRYDMRIEEENKNYDPWGRGGAGAPVRDRAGNTITVRGQLGQGGNAKRVSVVAPVVDTSNSRRASHDRVDRVELREEETLPISALPSYGMQRSPRILKEQNQEPKTSYESYQEDLRKQIEDKKRREMEEKERDRLEEERLLQRIQDENEKMQREYEEDLRKQKERDEERRRRNEELLLHQQEVRKEEERKRREEREKDRRQSYEDREKAFGRGPTASTAAKSPPIRSKRNPSISRPIEKPKQKSNKASDASKEHVLSQLSAMRQQLEREQKTMQEQLREQMKKDDYEVFDKQQQPQLAAPSTEQSESQTNGRPPPIEYRSISRINETNHQSEGVESNDVENEDGNYSGWNESKARKTWNVYDDLEPQQMPDRELMKQQHEYNEQRDPDEVRDESFLDEFLAKNLQKR